MDKRLFVALVAACVAAGCSGEKAGSHSPSAARAPVATGDDTVAAVSQSGASIAALRFAVVTKPAVGAQSDLRLDLFAEAAVPELLVQAEAEAITVDPATAKASVAIEAGKTASHTLRITPRREGLTRVTVRLRSGADGAESVYDIPVLVGAAGG